MRLTVVRGVNWKGQPGWEWVYPPCPAHDRTIRGFTRDVTFTRLHRGKRMRPPQSQAMDGARRHLYRFHRTHDEQE